MRQKILIAILLLCVTQSIANAQQMKIPKKTEQALQPSSSISVGDITPEKTGKEKDLKESPPPKDGEVYDNNKKVIPEVAVFVELSNVDVNRIVCQGEVKDVVYSKEKGVNVKIIDNNIFIKFVIIKEDRKETKVSKPSEFYIVCEDKVYNLIAIPKGIPSQTVRLGDNKINNIRKNAEMFKGLPFEKKISKLMKIIFTNNIPESFTTEAINEKVDLYKAIEITHIRRIKVEGEGIIVNEFIIKNTNDKIVELRETDFIDPVIANKIVAVSIASPTLTPNKSTRLFTVSVEKGEANE